MSRCVHRRQSSAERGRWRGRLRLKLAERRRGTGRPFPPTKNARTHPPSLRRRLGERPPAESPGAAEPSLPAPRRRREGAGAGRAAARRARVRAGRVGKSLRGRGYLRAGGGAANAGGGGAGLRPRGGLWQPAPGRGRPRALHGLAATGHRFQPESGSLSLLGHSRDGRRCDRPGWGGERGCGTVSGGRQPVACSGSGRTLPLRGWCYTARILLPIAAGTQLTPPHPLLLSF